MAKNRENDIFENLIARLDEIPQEIQDIYEEVTIEYVDTKADALKEELKRTSGSRRLNEHMTDTKKYLKGSYYIRYIDWSDELVNPGRKYTLPSKGTGAGGKGRKRNFSLYPATWHDLAYIINRGNVKFSGKYFITNGVRNILKDWRKERDNEVLRRINDLGKDL